MLLAKIVTNLYFLLILLVVLTSLFHVIFVKYELVKIGKKHLVILEYIWLACAAVSLITVSSDVRKWVYKNFADFDEVGVKASYKRIVSNIESPIEYLQCHKDDFSSDEDRLTHEKTCKWLLNAQKNIPAYVKEKPPLFDDEIYTEFQVLNIEAYNGPILKIVSSVEQYHEWREEYLEKLNMTDSTLVEQVLRFIAPLLLAIGVSIKITKVTIDNKTA